MLEPMHLNQRYTTDVYLCHFSVSSPPCAVAFDSSLSMSSDASPAPTPEAPPPKAKSSTSNALDVLIRQVTTLVGTVDSLMEMHKDHMNEQKKTQSLVNNLLERMTALENHVQEASRSPPSQGQNPSDPVLSPHEAALSAALSIHADRDRLERKARRMVAINVRERDSLEETAKADEDFVSAVIQQVGLPELEDAFRKGEVTFHRHPENRNPNATEHKRPLKITLPTAMLRNATLDRIRSSARLPILFDHRHSFIRRDLSPAELALERANKQRAYEINRKEGKIICGLRDHELIYYKRTREFPSARA